MSGLGPPRGWRGSNAWAAAPSQPSDTAAGGRAVSGDHVERLRAAAAAPVTHGMDGCAIPPMAIVAQADLCAALDELEQLRAERGRVLAKLDAIASVPPLLANTDVVIGANAAVAAIRKALAAPQQPERDEPACLCGRACCGECGKNAEKPCACQVAERGGEAPDA